MVEFGGQNDVFDIFNFEEVFGGRKIRFVFDSFRLDFVFGVTLKFGHLLCFFPVFFSATIQTPLGLKLNPQVCYCSQTTICCRDKYATFCYTHIFLSLVVVNVFPTL